MQEEVVLAWLLSLASAAAGAAAGAAWTNWTNKTNQEREWARRDTELQRQSRHERLIRQVDPIRGYIEEVLTFTYTLSTRPEPSEVTIEATESRKKKLLTEFPGVRTKLVLLGESGMADRFDKFMWDFASWSTAVSRHNRQEARKCQSELQTKARALSKSLAELLDETRRETES